MKKTKSAFYTNLYNILVHSVCSFAFPSLLQAMKAQHELHIYINKMIGQAHKPMHTLNITVFGGERIHKK